jgi:nucleoside-diphosphate-sugar epimerase
MSKFDFTPAIPIGSTVLITGVNGYIGAQVADRLLSSGYRVRGTVRNPEKSQSLQATFDEKYGPGKFELVKVENINEEGAFNEAAKGVSGISHIAVDATFTGEPEPYITNMINGTLSIFRTAQAEPSVKRVVLTASSMGSVPWKTGVEYSFDTNTYNEDSIEKAYAPPFTADKAFFVYGAGKALTEKAAFKWIEENKPNFTYNAVLPAANFGVSASGAFGSTGGWAKLAAEGDFSFVQHISPRKWCLFCIQAWPDKLGS